MSSTKKNLKRQDKMPSFYKRYLDDTLTIVWDVTATTGFLETLSNCNSSVSLTMELQSIIFNKLLFLGMQI